MSDLKPSDLKPIKERIENLLSLALDQEGKPEGKLAAQRAAELMQKYGITSSGDTSTYGVESIEIPAASWRFQLAWAIQKLCGVFISKSYNAVRIHGLEKDRELAIYFFHSLCNQCDMYCKKWWIEQKLAAIEDPYHPKPSKSRAHDFRYSWVQGLDQKIRRLLDDQLAYVSQTGNELVCLSKSEKARDWAHDNFAFIQRAQPGRRFNGAGFDAGKGASLSRGISKGKGGGGFQRRLTG